MLLLRTTEAGLFVVIRHLRQVLTAQVATSLFRRADQDSSARDVRGIDPELPLAVELTYIQIKPPGSGSGAMTMRTALATKNPCSLGLSDVSRKASDQDGLLPNKTVDRQKHFYGDNFSRQQNQMIPGTRRNNGDRGDVQTCQCILNPLS